MLLDSEAELIKCSRKLMNGFRSISDQATARAFIEAPYEQAV